MFRGSGEAVGFAVRVLRSGLLLLAVCVDVRCGAAGTSPAAAAVAPRDGMRTGRTVLGLGPGPGMIWGMLLMFEL